MNKGAFIRQKTVKININKGYKRVRYKGYNKGIKKIVKSLIKSRNNRVSMI